MKRLLILVLSVLAMVGALTVITSCGKDDEPVTVSLDLGGGELTEIFDGSTKVGKTVILPTPKKERCYFAGWYSDAEYKGKVSTKYKVENGGDIKLYALFVEQIELEYKNLEGAAITNEDSFTRAFAPGYEQVVLPLVTRRGFELEGWYKDRECTERVSAYDVAASTYSTALYAKWRRADVSAGEPDVIDTFTGKTSSVSVNYAAELEAGKDYITYSVKFGSVRPENTEPEGVTWKGGGNSYSYELWFYDNVGVYDANGDLLAEYGDFKTLDVVLWFGHDDDKFVGGIKAYYYIDGEYKTMFRKPVINPDLYGKVFSWSNIMSSGAQFNMGDFSGTHETNIYRGSIYENVGAIESFTGASSEAGKNMRDLLINGDNYFKLTFTPSTAPTRDGCIQMKGSAGDALQLVIFDKYGIYAVDEPGALEKGALVTTFASASSVEIVIWLGNALDQFAGGVKLWYFVDGEIVASTATDTFAPDSGVSEYFELDADESLFSFVDFDGIHKTTICQGSPYSVDPTHGYLYYTVDGVVTKVEQYEFFVKNPVTYIPVKSGAEFDGWYFDSSCENERLLDNDADINGQYIDVWRAYDYVLTAKFN